MSVEYTTDNYTLQADNTTVCERCGKRMPKTHATEHGYACADCIEEYGYVLCEDCGRWTIPERITQTAGGKNVCATCLDKNYERCTDCGEWHYRDAMFALHDGGGYICNDCFNTDNYITCEDCGCVLLEDEAERVRHNNYSDVWDYYCPQCIREMRADGRIWVCDDCGEYVHRAWVHRDDSSTVVCDYCYEWNDWAPCYDCGRLIRSDDIYVHDDDYLCEDCYNEREENAESEYIHSYHAGACSGLHLHELDDEPAHNGHVRYFGLELEVDNGDDDDAIAEVFEALNGSFYAYEDTHAHFEHDGSLSAAGFEVITQPMTRAYLDTYRPHIEKATKILSRAGYRSHDARMCGLHIHVSRNTLTEQTVNNMIYAMSLFWHTCVRISRRTPEQLRSYATSYAYLDTDAPDDTPEKVLERAKAAKDSSRSRYFALNTTNRDTIELRICRGTLKVDTIYASIDFFCALIQFAETHNENDMLSMSTNDFIAYLKNYSTGLAAYMETRGL